MKKTVATTEEWKAMAGSGKSKNPKPKEIVVNWKAWGLEEPKREFRFMPPRKFSFDYAWKVGKSGGVALEVEGGFFGRGKKCPACGRSGVGAHTSIQRLLSDKEKYNEAQIRGWIVIRCTPSELSNFIDVVVLVRRALEAKHGSNEH